MGVRAVSVFYLLLGVYLATASFRIDTIDTAVRLEVARSLAAGAGAAVAPMEMRTPFGVVGSFPGADGRFYSVYGLGQSLVMVPFVALGGARDAGLVTLINPLAVAGTAALLVLIGAALGRSRRAAVGTALLFGLATLAWPHAKLTFEAPLEMFAGTLLWWGLLTRARAGVWTAGAAFGFALLVRPSAGVMVPAAGWLLATGAAGGVPGAAGGGFRAPVLRRVGAFAAGAAPFVVAALLYNAYRWGSVFATGYLQTEHDYLALQWEGLVGLLLSPGRGFFWFSPVLLLAFPGFRRLLAERRREAVGVALFAGAYLGFLSFLTVWNGDWTWGPRHLLPVVPVVALAVGPLLERGRLRPVVAAPLIALSVAVQLVGLSVNYETYYLWHLQWMRDTGVREPPAAAHFHASRSQIYVQFRQAQSFWGELRGRRATYVAGRDRSPYASILDGAPAITKRVPDLAWIYLPMAGVPSGARLAYAAVCLVLIGAGVHGLRRPERSG